jgi:hypothetical protein
MRKMENDIKEVSPLKPSEIIFEDLYNQIENFELSEEKKERLAKKVLEFDKAKDREQEEKIKLEMIGIIEKGIRGSVICENRDLESRVESLIANKIEKILEEAFVEKKNQPMEVEN